MSVGDSAIDVVAVAVYVGAASSKASLRSVCSKNMGGRGKCFPSFEITG